MTGTRTRTHSHSYTHALDRSLFSRSLQVNFLLDRGADPRIPSGRGWTVLQEACILKQKQVATDVHLHTILMKQNDWETKIPEFKKALAQVRALHYSAAHRTGPHRFSTPACG